MAYVLIMLLLGKKLVNMVWLSENKLMDNIILKKPAESFTFSNKTDPCNLDL